MVLNYSITEHRRRGRNRRPNIEYVAKELFKLLGQTKCQTKYEVRFSSAVERLVKDKINRTCFPY